MKLLCWICLCAVAINCGVEANAIQPNVNDSNLSISPRIKGGRNAADGLVPYQCALEQDLSHFCGCSILTIEWVISAAHCIVIVATDPDKIDILVGTNSLSTGGSRYRIKDFIMHENYDDKVHAFDIGLLRTRDPIAFDSRVQPVALSAEEVPSGANLVVTGWGQLSKSVFSKKPDKLQILFVQSISNEKCQQMSREPIHKSHLCTLNRFGEGICHADSGGPLVNMKDELVGIVSWGIPCGMGLPDGYVKISVLYEWIQSKIKSQ